MEETGTQFSWPWPGQAPGCHRHLENEPAERFLSLCISTLKKKILLELNIRKVKLKKSESNCCPLVAYYKRHFFLASLFLKKKNPSWGNEVKRMVKKAKRLKLLFLQQHVSIGDGLSAWRMWKMSQSSAPPPVCWPSRPPPALL